MTPPKPENPPLCDLRDLVVLRDLERAGILYYIQSFYLSMPPHQEQNQYGEHHDKHKDIDGQEHVYVRVHDVK